MVANGLQFTVTGLNSGTSYGYLVEAKSGSTTVASYTGEFETTGAPAIATASESVESSAMLGGLQKILRNGQLLIIRDGRTYTVQGQPLQ